MDSSWCSHFILRWNELEVKEDIVRKPEIGIDESILEVNSDRFCIILTEHSKHVEHIQKETNKLHTS